MTIELLTQEEYDELLSIQKEYPRLTFQNNGYEYINRTEFSDEEKVADARVRNILTKHIEDFRRFDNFKINAKGELQVRFQYMWSESFTGVGYITLRELLNGFDANKLDKPNELSNK